MLSEVHRAVFSLSMKIAIGCGISEDQYRLEFSTEESEVLATAAALQAPAALPGSGS